ncbi:GcrA cell cycle regulator [compost metagenome]
MGLLTGCIAMTSAIWTSERTEKLIALWKEGCTAAWIARVLGPGVSRCAVLGKVYRLGLARGPEARHAHPATVPRAKRRREEIVASQPAARPSGSCKARATGSSWLAAVATPSSPTTTILAVGFGQCRWPYGHSGEAGFGLCGRSVARGAFCASHAEVGYQKRSCTVESLLRMAGVD